MEAQGFAAIGEPKSLPGPSLKFVSNFHIFRCLQEVLPTCLSKTENKSLNFGRKGVRIQGLANDDF